jgi:hypothetical protein
MSQAVPKSWVRYYMAVIAALTSSDDPENTLTVALTHKDLCLIVLGLITGCQLFPETGQDGALLLEKIEELIDAQGFLPNISAD